MGRGLTKKYHQSLNNNYAKGTLTCLNSKSIKKINIDFPLILNIEPTNACNLHCIFCPREKNIKKHGVSYLPFKTYKRIIDEASDYRQLIMLNLHKDGEPLMHKKLPEMVAYAKKKNIAEVIHLNTNGTLLRTDVGRGILESGIDDITISVDAAFASTYQQLKQSSKFEELNENIEAFIEYRNRISAEAFIRVKIMEFDLISDIEINSFHDRWEGVADQVQVTGIHTWGGAIDDIKITDETPSVRYPCALLWYALAVNSNGMVSTCNVDWDYSGVLSTVHDKSLHAIWNAHRIREIRKAHLNARWDFVSGCSGCFEWANLDNLKSYLNSRIEFI